MTWGQAYNQRRRKPVPRDFAEMAQKLTLREAMAHYHVSNSVVARWARELGVQLARSNYKRSSTMPEWFPREAHTQTAAQWAHVCDVNPSTVYEWARKCGVRLRPGVKGFAAGTRTGHTREDLSWMPPTWPQRAHERTAPEWAALLGVHQKTVRMWAERAGVYCAVALRGRPTQRWIRKQQEARA